jgi:hypothetical protein
MAMWRYALTAIVALALVGFGIAAIAHGEAWIGIVFIGLAVLRTVSIFSGRKRPKPQPSIRLNLDDDNAGSGGTS